MKKLIATLALFLSLFAQGATEVGLNFENIGIPSEIIEVDTARLKGFASAMLSAYSKAYPAYASICGCTKLDFDRRATHIALLVNRIHQKFPISDSTEETPLHYMGLASGEGGHDLIVFSLLMRSGYHHLRFELIDPIYAGEGDCKKDCKQRFLDERGRLGRTDADSSFELSHGRDGEFELNHVVNEMLRIGKDIPDVIAMNDLSTSENLKLSVPISSGEQCFTIVQDTYNISCLSCMAPQLRELTLSFEKGCVPDSEGPPDSFFDDTCLEGTEWRCGTLAFDIKDHNESGTYGALLQASLSALGLRTLVSTPLLSLPSRRISPEWDLYVNMLAYLDDSKSAVKIRVEFLLNLALGRVIRYINSEGSVSGWQ